jgi:hypothetical protein
MFDVLRCGGDSPRTLCDRSDQRLNRINLSFFEVRLATLLADPSRHRVKNNVASFSVYV